MNHPINMYSGLSFIQIDLKGQVMRDEGQGVLRFCSRAIVQSKSLKKYLLTQLSSLNP